MGALHAYLGEINVEEEGLLSVRDLNTVLLVRIRDVDVDVVHSLRYAFHFRSLSLSLSQTRTMTTIKNPNRMFTTESDLRPKVQPHKHKVQLQDSFLSLSLSPPLDPGPIWPQTHLSYFGLIGPGPFFRTIAWFTL